MGPAVSSNYEQRLNAVKLAAQARVMRRYGLKDLFREHQIKPGGKGVFDVLGDAVSSIRHNGLRAGADSLRQSGGLAGFGRSVANTTKTVGKHVGEFGREAVFGSPITLKKQLADRYRQTGSVAKTVGGHAKDFYLSPQSPLWLRALSLGLPALDLGNTALNGDPATRHGDIAHAVTGLAVAPFSARLGLLGVPLQGAAQEAGRRLGAKFDPKTPPPPTPSWETLQAALPRHLGNVAKATGPAHFDDMFAYPGMDGLAP